MHSGITQKILATAVKQKKGKHFLLMLFVLLAGFSTLAQPANDDPCSATSLPLSTICINTPGTNVGSTPTQGIADPSCAAFNFSGNDVWFSFVAPAGGSVTISSTAGTLEDGAMEAYSGTCSALVPIECDDDGGPGSMPKLVLN